MIREHDDPAGVLAEARSRRPAVENVEAAQAAVWRPTGRRCTRPTRSSTAVARATATPADRDRRAGGAAGGGVRGRGARRRTRVSRQMPGAGTSGRRWSCATGSRGCGAGSPSGDLPAWKARRIAAINHRSDPRRGRVRRHPRRPRRAQGRPRSSSAGSSRRPSPGSCPPRPRSAAREAADGRYFTIDTRDTSLAGTRSVWGELDLADALDLDAAVTAGAEPLKALGSTDSLDVRRAAAVGDLARRQHTLDLNTDHRTMHDDDSGEPAGAAPRRQGAAGRVVRAPLRRRRHRPPARRVRPGGEHRGSGHRRADPDLVRQPRHPGHREAGDRPRTTTSTSTPTRCRGRLAEAAALIDPTCVFPWCTRPARRADCDHIDAARPPAHDGPTCSCNLAPLCRRHHRVKTHGGWTYTAVERGTYLWTKPARAQYLRDHDGTLDVTRTQPTARASRPAPAPTRPTGSDPAPHPADPGRGHRGVRNSPPADVRTCQHAAMSVTAPLAPARRAVAAAFFCQGLVFISLTTRLPASPGHAGTSPRSSCPCCC